eukprot:1996236-Rhodomonas_salina.1
MTGPNRNEIAVSCIRFRGVGQPEPEIGQIQTALGLRLRLENYAKLARTTFSLPECWRLRRRMLPTHRAFELETIFCACFPLAPGSSSSANSTGSLRIKLQESTLSGCSKPGCYSRVVQQYRSTLLQSDLTETRTL